MIEFYPQIKAVHILTVLASGGFFLMRGLLVLSGKNAIAMAAPIRYLSYSIDTVLLAAALMLVSVLPAVMFDNGWLTAKLVLLVIYVILGSFALKRAPTPFLRAICYLLALAVFAFMLSIARQHHPLGIFSDLS